MLASHSSARCQLCLCRSSSLSGLLLGALTSAAFCCLAASFSTQAVAMKAPTAPDSKALQDLWANAYEAWIAPAGSKDIVYLMPGNAPKQPEESEDECASVFPAWVEECLKVADKFGGLFGITAFNPMGQDTAHEANLQQNELLEADIKKLCQEVEGTYWRSFGFSKDWHEKGFAVAAPQDKVIKLAKKYNQGAVYRFYRAEGCGAAFMRATLPAMLSDTEADVPVMPCSQPQIDKADPNWTPVE